MHHILTYLFSRQVCGCDGKNYNNECQAHSLGMSISSYGPCPTMSPTMSPTRIPTSKPVTKIPTSKPTKKIPTSKPTSKQPTKQALVAAVAPMIGATTKTPTSKRPTSKRPTTKVPTKQVAQMSTTKPTECVLVCPSAPGTPIPDGVCAEISQPVCDCNGNQWGNACQATNAGITSF